MVTFSVDSGTLFLYVRENTTTYYNHYPSEEHPPYGQINDYTLKEHVMAISGGRLLWDVPISDEHHSDEDSNVYAQGGRVYVFDDYGITVFGENGTRLFSIGDASAPPAVDGQGNIYVVTCVSASDRRPSGIVQAYAPDATPLWQRRLYGNILKTEVITDLSYRYDTLPLYQNQVLYLPTDDFGDYSIVALNTRGDILWQKDFGKTQSRVVPDMPFDDQGRLYVMTPGGPNCVLHIISVDGSEITTSQQEYYGSNLAGDPAMGILWGIQIYNNWTDNASDARYPARNGINISRVSWAKLAALDAADNSVLWRYDGTPNRTYAITDSGKVGLTDPSLVGGGHDATVVPVWGGISAPGSDTEYLYWKWINYEWPVIVDRTVCVYISQLYALDKKSGQLRWQKQMDALVTSMTTANDTLYYGTEDGTVFGSFTSSQSEPAKAVAVAVTGDDPGKVVGVVAGGAVVTATALFFIKFFALGGLARARSQLATNDNRNRTLDFIVGHPGSTLHEIAHGLEMNVGTIRYHLFILSLNHRITSYKQGGKFVRYFTNSGSYTQDEQFVLSLVRRDPVRKILDLLLDKAELSPLEISEALEMHGSTTSRYLKELADRGVVAKHRLAGRTSYSLCREFREPVAMAIERINSD
jgi:predicted transcriptional regulator